MNTISERFSLTLVLAALLLGLAGAAAAAPDPPLPPPKVRAWQTGLMRADRLQHGSLAFTSGLSIGLLTREPLAGAGGALGLGLAKELWDRRRGRGFDWVDLAADGIGAGAAAAGTAVLRR